MRLELENEAEIMRYLNGFKEMDYKHQRLEHIIKSIIPELPKRVQDKIKKILDEGV
jgi:hypothetical protein